MADKRISQLVDRGTVVNNDVVPIVVSGATTTNKATISSIQTFMQGNLDLGVTSVGITIGTSGTNVSVTGSPVTSSGNITINIPTASATNRGALSSADWSTFNGKQNALTNPITGTGATGQVAYWNGTNSQTGSNNLFWDNANVKLGIGTNTPESTGLTIAGGGMIVSLDSGSARKVLELYATSTGAKVSSSYVGASSYGSLELLTSGLPRLTIASTGGVTLTGALNGTSATFSGLLTAIPTATTLVRAATFGNTSTNALSAASIGFNLGGGDFGAIEVGYNSNSPYMDFKVGASLTQSLRLASTGAATFSSSVDVYTNLVTTGNGSSSVLTMFNTTGTTDGAAIGYNTAMRFGTVTGVNAAGFTERMRITSGGNVGIGTASPAAKLDVRTGVAGALVNFTDGVAQTFQVSTTSTGIDISNPNSGYISFSNTSERMRITSSGNVGIGTASPTSLSGYILQTINGASGSFTEYQENGTNTFRVGSDIGAGGFLFTQGALPIRFGTNGSERIRITSAGLVGIGTSSPADSLHIAYNGAASYSAALWTNSSSTANLYVGVAGSGVANTSLRNNAYVMNASASALVLGTSDNERMRITSGGVVLVNRTTTLNNGFFEVNGDGSRSGVACNQISTASSAQIYFSNPNGIVGSIFSSGSATSYNTSSDYRLKENVNPVQNALSVLTQLKPCTFNFIADADEEVMGFIAHEVQEVIPQAVTGEKDGFKIKEVEVSPAELDEEGNIITEAVIEEKEIPVYQGIDHSKLVPLLVAAIQELKTEIDSLKNQMQ